MRFTTVATAFMVLSSLPLSAEAEELFACGVKIREGEMGKAECRESSGNGALDAKVASQVQHLRGAFHMDTDVCFVDDSPPNAWSRNDGKILIGRKLIRKEFEEYGNLALLGVFAHEWAHQAQFQKWPGTAIGGRIAELQADCVAGYHLGRFGKADEKEVTSFGRSLFSKGDYDFNSPAHHGTPESRLEVMLFGYQKGREQQTTGKEIFGLCLAEVSKKKEKKETSAEVPAIR